MFYGAAVWDPLLILAQILSLQCMFYLSLGLWQTVVLGPTHGSLTVVFIFGWDEVRWSDWEGCFNIGTNLLTSFVTSFLFVWIVERAKKCLDFAVTLYLIHFMLCWGYSGFPRSIAWWLTNALGVLLLSLLSEALCLRREMTEIPVTSTSRGRGGSVPPGPAVAPHPSKVRPGGGTNVQMSEVVAGVKITTRLLAVSEAESTRDQPSTSSMTTMTSQTGPVGMRTQSSSTLSLRMQV